MIARWVDKLLMRIAQRLRVAAWRLEADTTCLEIDLIYRAVQRSGRLDLMLVLREQSLEDEAE